MALLPAAPVEVTTRAHRLRVRCTRPHDAGLHTERWGDHAPSRYWNALTEAALYETAAGRIVLAPGCNLKEPHPLWATPQQADRLKTMPNDLHLQKIQLADQVLVVNPDGFIELHNGPEEPVG